MKKIFVLIIVLASIQMSAQTIVIAKHTSIDNGFEYKTQTANCDSFPSLDFIIKNFEFPNMIGSDIIWHINDSLHFENPASKMQFDSLNRISMYFYQGNMLSGIVPLFYRFEYSGSSNIVTQITENDVLEYIINYNDGTISSIIQYDLENKMIEAVKFEYSEE